MSSGQYSEKKGQSSRKSLVRRISAVQFFDLFSLVLFYDIVVLAALSVFVVNELCAVSMALSAPGIADYKYFPSVLFDGFERAMNAADPAGTRLLSFFSALMRLPEGSLVRLEFQQISQISFTAHWADVRSAFAIPAEGGLFAEIVFTHNSLFFNVFRAGAVVLILQALYLLRSFFTIRRRTRHTLRPIMELTLAAQSINAQTQRQAQPQARSAEPALKLSGAIDTLNTITERHLDKRILIEDERVELKGLASAINGMLDRLDAAYRAQQRFVSDASHELRTPISVIQGYVNLLDRWGKNDEKTLQESIDAIKNESESMKLLVEQLLFLARGENNSITVGKEDVDVSALAEEVVREAKMIDEEHEYQTNADAGLIITGDYQLLKQALRILVENSVKYTPAGGRIAVNAARSEERPGYVDLTVRDSGIGIAYDAIPHIFDRFYRSDESRARSSGGTGLGLSIAKWIIDSHQGLIDVVSREDAGTKITLSFREKRPAASAISV